MGDNHSLVVSQSNDSSTWEVLYVDCFTVLCCFVSARNQKRQHAGVLMRSKHCIVVY